MQMRKISILDGQNFGIHVEEKIKEDDFFFHEYEMAVRHLNEIWKSQTAPKKYQDDFWIENPNNIIAFCGERGSGKSSVMVSFIHALCESGKRDDQFQFLDEIRSNNWGSKVLIDPSMFDGVHNIVDIVMAHIFQSFSDAYQEDNQKFDQYEREHLYKLMSKVYKNLSIIKNKEKMLDDEYDEEGNIAKLQKLGESTQLKKTFGELVSVYLEMISKVKCRQGQKCEKLLIAIDDLDLCNEHAYDMAEQIRKYLILPNVIILMAIKIEQMQLGIEEKNKKDFKNIINGYTKLNFVNSENNNLSIAKFDTLNMEIIDMSKRYLTKLIPAARRIFLPDLNNIEFYLEVNNTGLLKNLEAETYITQAIREKTQMIFEPSDDDSYHYFVSANLREFVNFILFLNGLKSADTEQENSIYAQNLKDFYVYFINEILSQKVKENRLKTLEVVLECNDSIKNYNMRIYLNNILSQYIRNNNVYTGKGYEYPVDSLAAVLDGLDKASEYLTLKQDRQLLYYLRVYYTFILNQSYYENGKISDELIGGFIWGNKINTVIPRAISSDNRNLFSRGRFNTNIQRCWEIICQNLRDIGFSIEDNEQNIFQISNTGQYYVKRIQRNNSYGQISAWILMAALTSNITYSSDGKTGVYNGNFVYDNYSVCSFFVSPSIESYMGALCCWDKACERIQLELLGIEAEKVKEITEIIKKKNEKLIKVAQTIALNPDFSMRLLEYCQKNNDYKSGEGERTYRLYRIFLNNISIFFEMEKIETTDLSQIWLPAEKEDDGEGWRGILVDVCKILADMNTVELKLYNEQSDSEIIQNQEKQSLKQNFAMKVNNVSLNGYEERIKSIPRTLKNKSVRWVKEKLEDLANYIQEYSYKNKKLPDGLDGNVLVQLYSDVVDLYMENPEAVISLQQYNIYKQIVKMVIQNES